MRLIKFTIKNLLFVVAALVLFSTVGWAQAVTNGEKVIVCRDTANAEVKAASELDSAGLGSTYAKGKKYKTKQTGVGTSGDLAEFGAVQSAESAARASKHQASYANCMKACSVTLSNDPEMSVNMSMNDAEDQINKIIKNQCAWISKAAAAAQENTVMSSYSSFEGSRARKSLLTKVAIGAGAIGGGLLLLDHIDDKKDKKKEKKAEEEKYRAENGIIKDADGNDLMCFSQANFMRMECSEVMLGLCQGAKADTGGCRSFNSTYCASTGAGSNYCLYADAKTYCAQTGSVIASSPACTWSSGRSAECKKNPENVSCLYSGSADGLTLACQNYPNDPLCAAHAAGRIVVQGGTTPTAESIATTGADYGDGAGTGTTTDGSSVSMSSVIDSGSSTSGSADGSDSSVLATNDNMWSSSSTVTQQACADGLLQNCSN